MMAATDNRIETEIRRILEAHADTTQGWSDARIVAEASRRAGLDAAPDSATVAQWSARIAQMRGETDNDGMARADGDRPDQPARA